MNSGRVRAVGSECLAIAYPDTENLAYAYTSVVAHDSDRAFVAMAVNAITGKQITTAMKEYANRNPAVIFISLFNGIDTPA